MLRKMLSTNRSEASFSGNNFLIHFGGGSKSKLIRAKRSMLNKLTFLRFFKERPLKEG